MSKTRLIALILPAFLFFLFGLWTLFLSFYQIHPTVFLALFFSSNLIILISLALVVGLYFRWKQTSAEAEVPEDDDGC